MNYRNVLVCGDTHGNPYHAAHLFETALNLNADCLVQVGDFGLWEHVDQGGFLDLCSDLATQNDLPLYWIDGNHENFDILFSKYGPGGPYHHVTPEGFWRIREGVYYIPRGTRWRWSDVTLMGLGGAASIDKNSRLDEERIILEAYRGGGTSGRVMTLGPRLEEGQHVSWWPQEELTDGDVAKALEYLDPIDVLFTHDKPRNSEPGWNRPVLDRLVGNQNRIQYVVDRLKPKLLFHGHLHHPYEDTIRGFDYATRVISLDCDMDVDVYDPEILYTDVSVQKQLERSWTLLDLHKVKGYHPS